MAGNTIRLSQSIDDRDVVKAFRNQAKLIDRVAKKLDAVGSAGSRAGKKTASAFGEAGAKLGQFVGAMAGLGSLVGAVTTTIGAIKQEYDDLLRRQQSAALSQQSAAQALRGVRINFAADATVKDKDLEGVIQKLADQTRTPVGVVGGALSSAFSAKGSLTNQQAIDAVRTSLRVTPGDAGAAATTSGRLLDIAKFSDVKDSRAIGGFLINLQNASRVTQLEKLGASAVPAIGSLVARGDTVEQAGELFAGFSQLLNDVEGRRTGTTLQNLGTRLGRFVGERQGKDKRGRFNVPQAKIDEFEAAESTTQRIAVLQDSPLLRRQFLGKNTFEAGSQAVIEQVLSGEAKAVAELKQARKNVLPLNAAQADRFEAKVGRLEAGKFQPIQTTKQAAGVALEKFDLESEFGARTATVRDALTDTLEKIDFVGIDSFARNRALRVFEGTIATGKRSPEETGVLTLQTILSSQGSSALGTLGQSPDPKVITLLQDMIGIMKSQEQAFKDQASAQNRAQAKPQPVTVTNQPPRRQQSVPPAASRLGR